VHLIAYFQANEEKFHTDAHSLLKRNFFYLQNAFQYLRN